MFPDAGLIGQPIYSVARLLAHGLTEDAICLIMEKMANAAHFFGGNAIPDEDIQLSLNIAKSFSTQPILTPQRPLSRVLAGQSTNRHFRLQRA